MKKGWRKKAAAVTAVGMIAVVGCTYLFADSQKADAAKKEEASQEAEELRSITEQVANKSAPAPCGTLSKDESVYVTADAEGNVEEIIVSDWMKNAGTVHELEDQSELTDIKNVKGDEKFQKEGQKLTWKTKGTDIYYQGKTKKSLPVSVNITYKLNGKEVDVKELAGKSGSLEMNIQYTNHSRNTVKIQDKDTEVYTPFVMVTGMFLPTDNFTNVQIDHGKVISDASRDIVIGVAFPGLKQSLDLKEPDTEDTDFKIPESLTITADVTDFTMGPTLTLASSDMLGELGFDDINSFEDLQDSMKELSDASNRLVDGSGTLKDGISALQDKTGEFGDGIHTLNSGIGELHDGAEALASGVGDYTAGAAALAGGVTAYTAGASQLAEGIRTYTAGEESLASGVEELAAGTKELPGAVSNLNQGIQGVKSGLDSLTDEQKTQALLQGSSSVAEGIGTVNSTLKAIESVLDSGASAADVQTLLRSVVSGVKTSLTNDSAVLEILKGVQDVAGDYKGLADRAGLGDTFQAYYGQLEDCIHRLQENVDTETILLTQLQSAAGGTSGTSDLDTLKGYIHQLVEATGENSDLYQGAASVHSGIESVVEGSKAMKNIMDKVAEGSNTLNASAGSLRTGINSLKSGADELSSYNGELNKGASDLLAGSGDLISGVKELTGNNSALNNGAQALSLGTNTLQNGGSRLMDGSEQLTSGVKQLADGSRDLADGMKEFDETGIQKLSEVFDGDIQTLKDRIDAVMDEGERYQSFSGISDQMDGNVKFIIETAEIK